MIWACFSVLLWIFNFSESCGASPWRHNSYYLQYTFSFSISKIWLVLSWSFFISENSAFFNSALIASFSPNNVTTGTCFKMSWFSSRDCSWANAKSSVSTWSSYEFQSSQHIYLNEPTSTSDVNKRYFSLESYSVVEADESRSASSDKALESSIRLFKWEPYGDTEIRYLCFCIGSWDRWKSSVREIAFNRPNSKMSWTLSSPLALIGLHRGDIITP